MAALTITAASVVAGADAVKDSGVAGEAITAGQAVYRSSSTKKWMLADTNSATVEARIAKGIALNGAALNQTIQVQVSGDITIGATVTRGVAYYLSGTPGGIAPVADLLTGDYTCILGIAKSASVISLDIQSAGVAI